MLDPNHIVKLVANTDDGKTWLMEYDPATGKLTAVRELAGKGGTPPPGASLPPLKTIPNPDSGTGSEPKPGTPPESDFDDIERLGLKVPRNPEDDNTDLKPTMEDSVFRARLSSIMIDNMYDRRLKGRTRGKLDMRRLWKAHVGATNLFTQKMARKNKEYNIVLLVDESGSMQGEKIEQAAEIATFLAATFEGLNLNLAIVGFNHYIHLHKDFDEKVKDYNLLQETIFQGPNFGGNENFDYEAMSYAYRMFRHRTKGQNFLIMLSDGEPTEDKIIDHVLKNPRELEQAIKAHESWAWVEDYSGKEQTLWVDTSTKLTAGQRNQIKNFHALVHANPNVTSIGIGIQSNNWQMPNHIRENNLDKLKPVLLKEIQKQIKRG